MNILKILFFISSISLLVSYIYIKSLNPPSTHRNETRNFSILFWTPIFGKEDLNLGLGSEMFNNCEFSNCFATKNRSLLDIKDFSALIFHHFDFDANDLPPRRSPEQYYIYFNLESPVYTTRKPWNSFYNWTMTYRSDSDIVHPYGYLKKQRTEYKKPKINEILKKRGKIVWFASHCLTASGREKISKEIGLYMPVDVIGSCNPMSSIICPKRIQDECNKIIESNYKFYLSFENSLCKDYVTEKFFNILKLDVIPIVYGNSNYTKIAPPNSFINVRDFHNVTDLVDYLKKLDGNPDLYLKYFDWKKDCTIEIYPEKTLCDLCEKLNKPTVYKTYDDMRDWWSSENCEAGYELDDVRTTEKSKEDYFRSLIQK